MSILNALRGLRGEFEVQRVLGAFGTITYVVMAPAFVWAGKVTASLEGFCLQYPIGLAACLGATAGAIALKDRSVATATVIQNTGAAPGKAAEGAAALGSGPTGRPDDPVSVTETSS